MSSRHAAPTRTSTACLAFALAAAVAAATPGVAAERFVEQASAAHGPATWLSLHADRIAFGSGATLRVATVGPTVRLAGSRDLPRPTAGGVLVAERLYTLAPDGIRVLRLDEPALGETLAAPLAAGEHGARLARMDDFLILARSGAGLAWFRVPHHGHEGHAAGESLAPAGALRLDAGIAAIGSSFRRVYVATTDGRLLLVDARDPSRPLVAGEVAIGGEARAVVGRAEVAFVALDDRLLTVGFGDDGSASLLDEQPMAGVRALALAGRTLYAAVGERGVAVLRDSTEGGILVPVTVGSNFFQPSSVALDAGDTIRWEKSNLGLHNVESCDGVGTDPAFCAGATSPDGSWSSGGPTSSPFTFSHTFANAGTHPYFCVVHSGLGMNGTVAVADAAPAPPTVPEGVAGTPLLVAKNDATGDLLTLSWDDATCAGTADHHVVYGAGQDLPAVLGGAYGVAGGACDIGASSPFQWMSPSTALDPGGLLWFLVVADDDGAVEGAWGDDAAGGERNGPGAGGSSGVCGVTGKDLSNTCGS